MAANWNDNVDSLFSSALIIKWTNAIFCLLFLVCDKHDADMLYHCIQLIFNMQQMHTHCCKTTRAFPYCCTAANQTDHEEKSPDCDYYDSRNQSVHVFKEVVVVVVGDEHIGANVA